MANQGNAYWLRKHSADEVVREHMRAAPDGRGVVSAPVAHRPTDGTPWPLGQEYGAELIALSFIVFDMMSISVAAVLAEYFLLGGVDQEPVRASVAMVIFAAFMTIFALFVSETYKIREEKFRLVSSLRPAAGVLTAILASAGMALAIGVEDPPLAAALALFGLLATTFLTMPRLMFRSRLVQLINVAMNRRAVLHGDAECIARFLTNPGLGSHNIEVVGILDAEGLPRVGAVDHPTLPRIGSWTELRARVWRNDINMLILAPAADHREGLADLIDGFACLNIEIHLANDLPELDGYVERRAIPPTRRILGAPISGLGALGKRLFDVVGASVLLILTMPVLIVAALAIALETPGGVFFRQDRVGYRDARFRIWKFRSMHTAPSSNDAGGGVRQATRGDARVTRVGALLRRSSIDELPQLFNVLCGDMSLVGPRPHAPRTLAGGVPFEDVVDCYSARHRVRPGLTGLAQVRGLRGQTDTEAQVRARVASDFEYIRGWSLWLDVAILFRTVGVVLKMHNAH